MMKYVDGEAHSVGGVVVEDRSVICMTRCDHGLKFNFDERFMFIVKPIVILGANSLDIHEAYAL